jgi:hypothetical protein
VPMLWNAARMFNCTTTTQGTFLVEVSTFHWVKPCTLSRCRGTRMNHTQKRGDRSWLKDVAGMLGCCCCNKIGILA